MSYSIESYSAYNRSFAGHRYMIEKTMKEQTGIVNPTFQLGPAHGLDVTTYSAFLGGCMMANGLGVLCPANAPNIMLYDYLTQELHVGPSLPISGAGQFANAVPIDERYVALIPSEADHVYFYDTVTQGIERGPAHGKGGGAFRTGRVTEDIDGRPVLIMAPFGNGTGTASGSRNIGIVYLDTREYVDGPLTYEGKLTSAQLLADGRIVFIKLGDTPVGEPLETCLVYNPYTNELVNTTSVNTVSYSSVLTSKNQIICDGSSGSRIRTINPSRKSDTWSTIESAAFSTPAPSQRWGSLLAANGDAIFIPFYGSKIAYYTPPGKTNYNGVLNEGIGITNGVNNGNYAGGFMCPDGSIVMIPYKHTHLGIYKHLSGGMGFPIEVCSSKFYANSY